MRLLTKCGSSRNKSTRNKSTRNKSTRNKSKRNKSKRNKSKRNKSKRNKSKLRGRSSKKGGNGSNDVEDFVFDETYLDNYESNLAIVLNKIQTISGKYSIDMTIANEFITNQISPARRQAAKDLVENTTYITFQEVKQTIEQLIDNLYLNTNNSEFAVKPIYLYVGEKHKSFYFLSLLAVAHIKTRGYTLPVKFVSIITTKFLRYIDGAPLIILDDAAYSATQLSTMLHHIYFDTVITYKFTTPPNIYVLLIALNNFALTFLTEVPTVKITKTVFANYIPSPFKLLYLKERLYTPLVVKIGLQRYFNVNIFFSVYTSHQPFLSLYFDHKLADSVSTYKTALTYGPIVPATYDYNELMINNFDYIYEFIHYHSLSRPNNVITAYYTELFDKFNATYNTTFIYTSLDKFGFLSRVIANLQADDIIDNNNNGATQTAFKPFINTCNTQQELIDITTNPLVKNLNYALFIATHDDIEEQDKNGILELYTNKHNTNYTIEQIRQTNKLITDFGCPPAWYKTQQWN